MFAFFVGYTGLVLKRASKLIGIFMGASLSTQLEYRANFVVNLVETVLRILGSLLGLSILVGDAQNIGGWSLLEAAVVLGIFTLFDGIMSLSLFPNLSRIAEGVRTGTMDFTLLKPIDAQFLVSFRHFNLLRLPDVLLGVGIVIWAVVQRSPRPNLGQLGLGLLLLCTAYLMVYAICLMLSTTAFWFVRVENIIELFWGFYRAGQFPISVFPGWVRLFFTFVIPIAFITTVPAQAFTGKLEGNTVWVALGLAVGLLALSRWFWRFALRSYTSASS
jgi:ABC-2 type transport system permease protein